MMLLDAAPPPPVAMRSIDPVCELGEPIWSLSDTALIALSLFTVWAAHTGRVLRDVPIGEHTPEEIIEFWVDDQLEARYAAVPLP
jgi:hypothetical protein